jgi:hypothetical protein
VNCSKIERLDDVAVHANRLKRVVADQAADISMLKGLRRGNGRRVLRGMAASLVARLDEQLVAVSIWS